MRTFLRILLIVQVVWLLRLSGTAQVTQPQQTIAAAYNITGVVTASGCTVANGVCTVASSQASITFTVIPTTYNQIEIYASGSHTGATNNDTAIQFNADTGANYNRQYLYGAATTVAAGQSIGATGCNVWGIPGTGDIATLPGSAHIILYNPGSTAVLKTLTSNNLASTSNAASGINFLNYGCYWNNTAAITSIKFTVNGGNSFAAGTTISLYGIN
jgi:hypothetical protein